MGEKEIGLDLPSSPPLQRPFYVCLVIDRQRGPWGQKGRSLSADKNTDGYSRSHLTWLPSLVTVYRFSVINWLPCAVGRDPGIEDRWVR